MDKKSADARGIATRVKLRLQGLMKMIGAEKGFAFAPAAAPDNLPLLFDNKVSSVRDELAVHAVNRAESRFNLRG
jgi:hypothetical protein